MGNLSWRDGNYTNEEGAYRHISKLFTAGVLTSTAIQVTQRGAGANMSIDAAPGESYIESGLGYHHAGWLPSTKNISINASNPSNPRRTLIVEYINKSIANSTPGSNNAPTGYDVIAVDGTPASVPADPSSGTIQAAVGSGNPYRVVARVAVAASATSITNANITDLRTFSMMPVGLLSPLSVSSAQLTTDAVEMAKVKNGAISPEKRAGGYYAGTFTAPGSTGDFSITGLSFRPKFVRFFYLSVSSGTNFGDYDRGMQGVMDENGNQWAKGWYQHTNFQTKFQRTNSGCWFMVSHAGGALSTTLSATFVSMNSDGFTVNVSNANTVLIGYEAFG